MARIAGVDLPREKRVEIGLTYIYGIGVASSNRTASRETPVRAPRIITKRTSTTSSYRAATPHPPL